MSDFLFDFGLVLIITSIFAFILGVSYIIFKKFVNIDKFANWFNDESMDNE